MIDVHTLQRVDPRLSLGAVLLYGVALWNTGWWGLFLFYVIFSPVAFAVMQQGKNVAGSIRRFLFFVLFWTVLKLIFDMIDDSTIATAATVALFWGLRLMALLLLGFVFARVTSARKIGQSVTWVIAPLVGRERASRFALALALMVHFIPQSVESVRQAQQAVRIRHPKASAYGRMVLVPQMMLRFMGRKTWTQAVAVTVRGLDAASAWTPSFSWNRRDSGITCLVTLGVLALFLL